MSSGFPSVLDAFRTDHQNWNPALGIEEIIDAGDINDLAAAVNKIEAELGSDPSGSYATVAARFAAFGLPVPFFNVKDPVYGATGDGATNDRAAVRAAIAAAEAAGGGIVFFPAGTYLLNTRTANSLLWINGNYITLLGAPGATLKTTLSNTSYCEMITVGPTLASLVDPFAKSVYTLSGTYTTGVMSLTLATPGDAANLSRGDYVLVRTGQTLSGGIGNPDGELNKVASADPATGIVTLQWPTAKPYQQEYFITGTSGVTSTTVTANAALYGIAKVSDCTLHNVAVRGLKFTADNDGYWGFGGGVMIDGFDLTDCEYEAPKGGLGSPGRRRWSKILRNRARTWNTGGVTYYHYATDTCVSDCDIIGNVGINEDGVSNLHIHEGSANVNAWCNRIYSQNVTGDKQPISVRARAYNISILDNLIVGGGTTYGLFVDDTCTGGGQIDGNTFVGGFPTAIAISSPNWLIGNRNRPGDSIIQFFESGLAPVERLNNTVTVARPTASLGKLPAYSMVLNVYLWVEEAFDPAGAGTISVGYSGSTAAIAPAQSVKATGRFAPALTSGLNRTTRDLNAYYTEAGAPATHGKVVVVVEYCRVRDAYA